MAEDRILVLKSSEIKWKTSNESHFSEVTEQNESVIERYKTNVLELEKKVLGEERIVKDKDEVIKKLENRVNEMNY